ncbi:hypothetical protein EKK58_04135 [Candidatus Dependentiae bacterium]|nr:MAG: hypothetical protein EKK58_04135 [Candidatus Dependentiae bacterium]
MSFNTSLLFTTLFLATNSSIFAGRSFKDQKEHLNKKYLSTKIVAAKFLLYQKKQEQIKQHRTDKYNPDHNTIKKLPAIPVELKQTRNDIIF